MARYAVRTCADCGLRLPQPQMTQVVREVDVARGRDSINGLTVIGAVLGDRKSTRKIKSTFFNSGERVYKRKVKAWLCTNCMPEDEVKAAGSCLVILIRWIFYAFLAVFLFAIGSHILMSIGRSLQ